jgi:hypothetical protein
MRSTLHMAVSLDSWHIQLMHFSNVSRTAIFSTIAIVFNKAYTKPPRSRSIEKPNMVKFRALFGEASRHKKGQTADLFTAHVLSISAKCQTYSSTFKSHNNCSKCGKEFSDKNAKKYVDDQKSSIFVNIATNNLN